MQLPPLVPPLLVSLALAFGAVPAAAQITILSGTTTRTVSITGSHVHHIAASANGSLWTVLVNNDNVIGTSDTVLVESTDGGKTWKNLYFYQTKAQRNRGAICMGNDCSTLHTVWTDSLTNGFPNLHYQTFDTRTKKWIGSPLLLQTASATVKWFPHDIQVTRKGTVIVGVASGANGGPGFTGRSTIVFVKKLGATSFSAPIKVNRSRSIADRGKAPSLHVEDEILHIIYRTQRSRTPGVQWGFSYRALNTETLKFLQTNDVHIGPNDNAGVNGGNNKATARDQAGNLYCTYVSPNKLRMAYGPKGKTGTNAGWQDITITADTGLLGGNAPTGAYTHFSMSSGPNNRVDVVYSKLSEKHKNLYIQTFITGKPLLPPPLKNERVLKTTTEDNSFLKVSGYQNVRKMSGTFFTTSGTPKSNPNGVALFWNISGNAARAVEYGISCQGNLSVNPRLHALTLPLLGKQFDLQWDGLPKTAPFFLVLDFNCSPSPFDMSVMGAPKCFLYGPLAVPIGPIPAQAAGNFKFSTTLPGDPKLVGAHIILQSVLLANGANGAGLLATNAVGLFF